MRKADRHYIRSRINQPDYLNRADLKGLTTILKE